MTQSYRIDYLEFPSIDGAGSRSFYEKAFGWSFVSYGPSYLGFESAGIDAGIQSAAEEATSAPLAVIRCADLEEAERSVVAAGGTISRPAFDFPGGRRFHFREPGGVELAVYISTDGEDP